ETACGWQTAELSTPMHVDAGTRCVAAYNTAGGFTYEPNYFGDPPSVSFPDIGQPAHHGDQGIFQFPLRAHGDGENVGGTVRQNGVYVYGPPGSFPAFSWAHSNYWVDVLFRARLR